ncbi:fructose-1,6-bisphosphatase [Cognaticolwellia beringensis]|uniref:fructose-1,6-bisphosphatase n=1 Tax=Cognaticolwellia beringensis TaxID=1967665 RepID=UPI001C11834C|nr:fructose-1,6-bisphosphatase [Cognaticolwellia beringensis]
MKANDETELSLLAGVYPSIAAVTSAIKELEDELNLPKGTEHFVSDLHGEYESFCHVIKNGSGSISQAIDETFTQQLSAAEKHQLTALICYPEEVFSHKGDGVNLEALCSVQSLVRLVIICRFFTKFNARSTVKELMPANFSRPLATLLFDFQTGSELSSPCLNILDNLVASGSVKEFIVAIAELIQKLAISKLHVIGDIYDRGPGAHQIMDMLMKYHSVDVQWGNHDILWMGAAAGSEACIATAIRIALRYTDLDTLQSGYGINLLPLAALAVELYGDDPCEQFQPKVPAEQILPNHDRRLLAQMQKAIAIIQLKLEGQIVQRRPQYQMNDRLLLDKIDLAAGTVSIDQVSYPLIDQHFPTISADSPYTLSEDEQSVIEQLKLAFTASKSLQQHVRFLYSHGAMYHVSNGHLLYHGCVAMNDDGSFKAFKVAGKEFAGKAFVDRVDALARQGYFSPVGSEEKAYGEDAMWYLWCGEQSPLFGKQRMATFERYFIADTATHAEGRNAYYVLRNEAQSARKILQEFGIAPDTGRIVNGHVPVKVKKGESPIKADGKLLVIDGGFAKAYRGETGIAGYTLVANADSLSLVAHPPFESVKAYIEQGPQMEPDVECVETMSPALQVKDCEEALQINEGIVSLKSLLSAHQMGQLKQQ